MKKILSISLCVALLAVLTTSSACVALIQVPDSHYTSAQSAPIDPNADQCVTELLTYLKSVYGKRVLTGQYINEYEDFSAPYFRKDPSDPDSEMTVFRANELQAVYSVTQDYPALLGLDLSGIECGESCYSVQQALEWHDAGGIVTLCWHWKVDALDGSPREFYTEKTSFDLSAALDDRDGALFQGLLADMDAISTALKPLAQAGVPVLWRPLHEASGGWFWWGASGADAYKELWDIVYDRMTNVHGLHNLIWVCNCQDADWYVGDDKCDIIGDDPYYPDNSRKKYLDDPSNSLRFKKTYDYGENKMIMMSENDFVPDIDAAFAENTRWLTFCTWCREFVCVYEQDSSGNYRTSAEYNGFASEEELKAAYSNEKAVTLSNLAESGYAPHGRA